jgi:hypothetical protein
MDLSRKGLHVGRPNLFAAIVGAVLALSLSVALPSQSATGREVVRGDDRVVFRPVLPEFKPLPELDLRFVEDHTQDDTDWPDETNEVKKEAEVVEHLFRFIRTHGADLRLRADPKLRCEEMLKEPAVHRGKVIRTCVTVTEKHGTFDWPKNDSGVQDVTMLFCRPTDATFGRGLIVVLTSQPPEDFKEEEFYDLTGVFWKRYAGIDGRCDGRQPLILTMQMTPAPLPAAVSHQATMGIIVAAAVLIVGLLFLVRGETREGQAKRAARIERRRRQQRLLPRAGGLAPLQPAGDPHEPPIPPSAPPAPLAQEPNPTIPARSRAPENPTREP